MSNETYLTVDLAGKILVSDQSPYVKEAQHHPPQVGASRLNVWAGALSLSASLLPPIALLSDKEESMEDKFSRLADRWERETRFLSSVGDIVTHKDYLQIMALGVDVVPLILKRMKRKRGLWFDALSFLTRDDPVTDDIRGDIRAMTDAWIEWGEENEYC
jgi:hypothetical protein